MDDDVKQGTILEPKHGAMQAVPDVFIAETQLWVQQFVVGLNMCPFAKSVMSKGQIRYVVNMSDEAHDILALIDQEMMNLFEVLDPSVETVLLILPKVSQDFWEFQFLTQACRRRIKALGLKGEIQIADFHPHYEFAHTDPSEIGNATNRSPYPMLHLLREEAVELARQSEQSAQQIVERNKQVLVNLGWEGLKIYIKS
jgi:hypothetical protein